MPRERPEWYREDGYVTTDDPTIKAVNTAFTKWVHRMLKEGGHGGGDAAHMRISTNDIEELFFSVLEGLGKL